VLGHLEVGLEKRRGEFALVAAQGESDVVVPPKGGGGVEAHLPVVVQVDPPHGLLGGSLVYGLEGLPGEILSNIGIEVAGGKITRDTELTDGDGA